MPTFNNHVYVHKFILGDPIYVDSNLFTGTLVDALRLFTPLVTGKETLKQTDSNQMC